MLSERLALLVRAAGARVERPLVQRREEDRRIVADDVLRPVPVVDVPVDDRHSLDAELGLRPARRDRDRVEQAEAHGARPFGVMAGRPRQREPLAAHGVDRRTRGQQRCVERRLRADRVAVDPARASSAPARRVPACGSAARSASVAGSALGEREARVQCLDPSLRLRMTARRVQAARSRGGLRARSAYRLEDLVERPHAPRAADQVTEQRGVRAVAALVRGDLRDLQQRIRIGA